jgi:four helix bundle protein
MQHLKVLELSRMLAVEALKWRKQLVELGYHEIAVQLSKSGTSVGANISEAQTPESRKDFIHKMKIAQKELEETNFWLQTAINSGLLNPTPESKQIIRLLKSKLKKIILTAKRNEAAMRTK